MFLAKVIGAVVSTQKEDALSGQKLLILRPMLVDEKDPTTFRPGTNTVVAVDNLGAGEGERYKTRGLLMKNVIFSRFKKIHEHSACNFWIY